MRQWLITITVTLTLCTRALTFLLLLMRLFCILDFKPLLTHAVVLITHRRLKNKQPLTNLNVFSCQPEALKSLLCIELCLTPKQLALTIVAS